ncbi:GGDEF domain-containing protein [Thalassomonas viridans]|uniref:GGDEF domain-containing protein n=1 Tax=Thalassomonas viridans TaxID=137584 RepID=A0AAF0CAE7_9GAMM|nr:GGDEF domain-containing protein [Thalassomonas viridans]WDE06793.1 GGDEF domain-containing protein [Thalassomonas viridans]
MSADLEKQIASLSGDIAALHLTLDNIGAYVYIKDLHGCYTYVNKMVRELFACPLEEIIGQSDSKFFSVEQSGELMINDRVVMEQSQTVEAEEKNIIHSTGEVRYYWTVKKPLFDEQGQVKGMYGISTDITERKLLDIKLKENEKLLDTVLNNVDAHIYMKDRDCRFRYINASTARLFGQQPDEIIGKKGEDFLPPETAADFAILDNKLLATGEKVSGEESFSDGKGNTRYYWSTKVPIKDEQEQITSFIGFSNDITELIALKKNLEVKANTDELTQLANRRNFIDQAEKEFIRARRYHLPLSLLAIDIDCFKDINDTYGHHVGDQVLKEVAAVCAANLRGADCIGRMGGEEFSVLLPETGGDAARVMAERLCRQVRDYQLAGPRKDAIKSTISIGISEMLAGDDDLDDMLIRADKALYKAKEGGRDRVCT